MIKHTAIAVGIASVLTLAACSSAGTDSTSGDSSSLQVGVVLPDTTSSARWEAFDKPYLVKAFAAADVSVDVQNAGGNAAKFASLATDMINRGAKILIVATIDSASGAAVEKKAAAAGVKVIDYDRLTLGGAADYYVSFDNEQVGKLQGAGLVSCIGNKANARIIEINGSKADNNATLFKNGYDDVLASQYAKGWTKVGDQWVAGWDNAKAHTIFTKALAAADNDVDGVLVANDGMAQEVIKVLKKAGLKNVQLTGQDATVDGLKSILLGKQCMTVYKAVKAEANGAAAAAVALLEGGSVATTGVTRDTQNNRDVKSVLLRPESIMASQVREVVADGFVAKDDICSTPTLKKKCDQYGVEG